MTCTDCFHVMWRIIEPSPTALQAMQ
jgi:hypothetical protein